MKDKKRVHKHYFSKSGKMTKYVTIVYTRIPDKLFYHDMERRCNKFGLIVSKTSNCIYCKQTYKPCRLYSHNVYIRIRIFLQTFELLFVQIICAIHVTKEK